MLGEGLTAPHFKRRECYEMFHRAFYLDSLEHRILGRCIEQVHWKKIPSEFAEFKLDALAVQQGRWGNRDLGLSRRIILKWI
jgi:hypothetical protein